MMPTLLSSSGPSTPLSYVHRRFGSVARSVDPSPSMVPNRQRGSDAPSAVGAPTPPTQLGAFQVSRQPLPPSSLSSQHCYNIAHSSSSYLDPRQRAQSVRPFSTSSLSSQGAAHRPSSTMSMPGSRSLSRQPPPPQALHRSMSHLSSTTQQQQQQQQSQHHHSSSQQLPPFSRQEYLPPPPPPPPAAATTMGSTFMGGFAQQLQERSRSLHQQTSSSTSVLLASQPPPLRSHTPPGSLAARRAISHSNATRGENVRERGPIMSANSQHEPQRQQYHHHQVAHHPPSDSFHSSFDAARTHPQPLSRGSISQSYAPAPEQQPPTTSNYAQAAAASNFCARGAPAPRPRQQEEEGEDELRRSSAPSTVPTYLQRAAVAVPRPPHTSLSSFTPQPLPLTPRQLEPQGRRSGPASSLSADHNQGDTVIIIRRKHTSAVTTTAAASTQCNLDECLLDSLRSLQEASASHQMTIASLQRERQELEEKLCAERERRQAAEQRCSDLAAAAVAESAARRERDTFSLPSHQPLNPSPSTAALQRTRVPPTGKKRARSPTSEVSEQRAPEKNDSEHLHHFTGAAMNDAEDGDCSAAAGHAVATLSCPRRVSPTVDHHHHRQEGTLTTATTKTSSDNVIQVRRRPSFIRKSAAAPIDRGAAYERSIVDIFADLV